MIKEKFAFPLISPDGVSQNLGMSIRDYIAIHALQGMLANGGINGHMDGKGDAENHAIWAYEYADSMIKNSNDIEQPVEEIPQMSGTMKALNNLTNLSQ